MAAYVTAEVMQAAVTAMQTSLGEKVGKEELETLVNAAGYVKAGDIPEIPTLSIEENDGTYTLTLGDQSIEFSSSGECTCVMPSKVSELENDTGFLVEADIENKVDKVLGKGLSTNDFTTEYKNMLDNMEEMTVADFEAMWN